MSWDAEHSSLYFRAWDYYSQTLRKYYTVLENIDTSIPDFKFLDELLNYLDCNENEKEVLCKSIEAANPCITVGRNGPKTRVIDLRVLQRNFTESEVLHKKIEITGFDIDIRDLYSLVWFLLTNTDLAHEKDPRIHFLEQLGFRLDENFNKRPRGFFPASNHVPNGMLEKTINISIKQLLKMQVIILTGFGLLSILVTTLVFHLRSFSQ